MPVSKQTKIDYAQTVLDLQEKLSRATAVRETDTHLSSKNLVKSQQEDSNQTASISSDSSKNLVKPGLGKFAWSTCNFKSTLQKKIFEHYSLDGKKTYATLTDFFHCCSKDTNSFCLHIVSIEIKRLERRDTTEYEICERYCMFSTVQ